PQDEIDQLETKDAVQSESLLGVVYPDPNEDSAESENEDDLVEHDIPILPVQSRSPASIKKRQAASSLEHSENGCNSRSKRAKGETQAEASATPAPKPHYVGPRRWTEESRRRAVLAGKQRPFDPKKESSSSLRRKHLSKAETIQVKGFSTANNTIRTAPGFVGLPDLGNKEPAANPTTKVSTPSKPITPDMPRYLKRLLKAGYRYILSNIRIDQPIVNGDGVVVGVIGGIPKKLRERRAELNQAVEDFTRTLGKEQSEHGGRRGNFRCAEYGVSYGGGQTHPMQFAKNRRTVQVKAWNQYNSNPAARDWEYYASDLCKTHFPEGFRKAEEMLQTLKAHNPALWPDGPPPMYPWASRTVNQKSAKTVAFNHRDISNFGLFVVGGHFDFPRGGQLVLHEYGLIIELQPGQILKGIPSSSTPPVVYFGTLQYGCRTWKTFAKQDPIAAKAFKDAFGAKWDTHWAKAPTVLGLKKIWENT
ncbi:hypothetical protein FRB90_004131, partial [Tulasnella sp. 427]